MKQLWRRLQYLRTRRQQEQELDDEMAFHREMMAREGRTPGHFGANVKLREDSADAWGWGWLDRLWQDIRFGARLLRRSPGFTTAAVLVLALGLGVNLTLFQLFDTVFLKPLPIREPQSWYKFWRHAPESSADSVSCPALRYYRANNRVLPAIEGINMGRAYWAENRSDLQTVAWITGGYFSELGAIPAFGRLISSADEKGDAAPVVVLSYTTWERKFARGLDVVGKVVHLNGKPVMVAGVAPVHFAGQRADAYAPLAQLPYLVEGSKTLTDFEEGSCMMFGRIGEGQSPEAAKAALQPLVDQLAHEHPTAFWKNEQLEPHFAGSVANTESINRPVATAFGCLVLLILLSACGNLGNMLLARAVAREREMRIRLSVGAGRLRLLRQLLTESLLLALLGTGVALLVSHWATC